MNKKIVSISALVILFAFGFLYSTYLSADNKDCSRCMFTDNLTKTATASVAKSENITSIVKNKNSDCSGNCTGTCPESMKDGKSSGKSSEQMKQSGKDCPNGNCCRNKKSKNI